MLRGKAWIKKTAIVTGGILGWIAAGAVAQANVGGNEHGAAHDTEAGDDHKQHAAAHGEHAEHWPEMTSSVPKADDAPWYPMVLGIAGGLFVAAVVVGVSNTRQGMKEPGQIASEHDAAHAHH